ncbi:MAG: hypothetical protein ABIT58_07910 [Ferruginibacter sp.]
MNKYFLKTICFLLFSVAVAAQKKNNQDYQERALEVQREIWDNGDKAFDVKEIPVKYDNESAIIIAKSFDVSNSSQKKFKMIHIWGGSVKQYRYFTTLRQRVIIKDKSALDDFSTLNYTKVVDNTASIRFYKLVNTFKTYIGAKILKPDGKINTINPDEEEVLTRNEDKSKEGKIAIPDLQIGDILDYYIRIEEVIEDESKVRGPNLFFLGDEYPILFYNVKYTLDKRCGADIMNMNGAKPMTKSINDDRDIVLEFTERDLVKITNTIWTSQARQIPYYVVRYGFPGTDIIAKVGEVKSGPFTEYYKDILKKAYMHSRIVDGAPQKNLEDYFGRRSIKNLPPDSVVNYLYNFFHWYEYGSFTTRNVSNDRNYNSMSYFYLAVQFSEHLKRLYNIENDIVIVCNRYSGRLNEVFGIGDFETLVRVTAGGKYTWLSFNNFFQNTGQLAAAYQGEDALTLTREGRGRRHDYTDEETTIKLPVMKSSDNVLVEKLKVGFNKDNMQLVTIERSCIQTGAMKENDQKKLMLAEEVQAAFAELINKKTAVKTLSGSKNMRGEGGEIMSALDKERAKQKDYFKDEIKQQYGQEAKELISYKIVNSGLDVNKPSFEYTQTFTMEDLVKKAGANFIFDAGKLMGIYKKAEEKERTRTLDVYMSCARTLTYEFTITIPEGYSVKGLEALNKKIENDVATYESTANLNGNMINITVNRVYKNNFEPHANWPKLLAVMDAAADFTGAKLLIEKNK